MPAAHEQPNTQALAAVISSGLRARAAAALGGRGLMSQTLPALPAMSTKSRLRSATQRRPPDLNDWSAEDVHGWLSELGEGGYAARCALEPLDGADLMNSTQEQLNEFLGAAPLGARKRLAGQLSYAKRRALSDGRVPLPPVARLNATA